MAASDGGPGSRTAMEAMTTQSLVDRASRGNDEAIRAIYERLRPRLLRWSHGRLPTYARDLSETEDIVQEALLGSLSNLQGFKQEGGGLLSYLCASVLNRARNEIRRVGRRPLRSELDEDLPGGEPSPIDNLIARESEDRYRHGLAKLSDDQQDLIIGRLELDMSFQELALHTGKPSGDAARMSFKRALRRLAESLADDESRG